MEFYVVFVVILVLLVLLVVLVVLVVLVPSTVVLTVEFPVVLVSLAALLAV